MKSPHSVSRHRLGAAIAAALFTFVLLLTLGLLAEDDGPPSCPGVRTGSVDVVSGGPRPCVLNGPAAAVTGKDTDGRASVPGSGRKTTKPGKASGNGAVKQPPKAPAVPAPKAPAPAPPKAPSLTKTR